MLSSAKPTDFQTAPIPIWPGLTTAVSSHPPSSFFHYIFHSSSRTAAVPTALKHFYKYNQPSCLKRDFHNTKLFDDMSPPSTSGYIGVPDDDELLSNPSLLQEKDSYHHPSHHPGRTRHSYVWWCLLAFFLWTVSVLIAVKLFAVTTVVQNTDIAAPEERVGCGSSSAEAEAMGCTFDPLVTSWLRPECPRDGTEEYLNALQKFNLSYWHEDENGGPGDRKVPDWEHFSHMDGEYYWSTFYEHLFHCVYMIKRIIHVERRNGRLDTIAHHIKHTDHCIDFIMEGLAKAPEELLGFQRTEAPIAYLMC